MKGKGQLPEISLCFERKVSFQYSPLFSAILCNIIHKRLPGILLFKIYNLKPYAQVTSYEILLIKYVFMTQGKREAGKANKTIPAMKQTSNH